MFSAGSFSELPFSADRASSGPSTQNLSPALFTNSNTFYTQTVTPGAVTLTPALFTNSNSFFTPTVGRGAVTLTPALFTNSNSFFTPTVGRGTITLAPGVLTNISVFFTPTVTGSSGATRDWRLLLRIRRLQPYKRRYRV